MQRNPSCELHDAHVKRRRLERKCRTVESRLPVPAEGDTDSVKLAAVMRAVAAVTDIECQTQGVDATDLYNSVVNAICFKTDRRPDTDKKDSHTVDTLKATKRDDEALLNEARSYHWQVSRILEQLQKRT